MPKYMPDAYMVQLLARENRPVELYSFYIEPTEGSYDSPSHRIAQAETDITFAGNVYTALGLKRQGSSESSDLQVNHISLELDNVPRTFATLLAKDLHHLHGKWVEIVRVFRDELTAGCGHTLFAGYIEDPASTGTRFTARLVNALNLNIKIPKRFLEPPCGLKFGDDWCSIDKEAAANKKTGFSFWGTTAGLLKDPVVLTQADDYWNDGYVRFETGRNAGLIRRVDDFDAATDAATLASDFPYEPRIGDKYTIYRGCNWTFARCEVYSNEANYGGFRHIPKDPMIRIGKHG